MKILLNGSPGVIIGYGTRSTPAKKALFVAGDMFSMDPQYMGGFKTSYGVEVTNGIAVPFPITDEKTLDGLSRCLDENIPLPVADLADRTALRNLTYADIWAGAKLEVEFDPDRCICCSFQCPAEYYCPMGAISWKDKRIDEDLCVACGACTANCMGGAFKGKGDLPRGSWVRLASSTGTFPSYSGSRTGTGPRGSPRTSRNSWREEIFCSPIRISS